jgi:hypothetical protein
MILDNTNLDEDTRKRLENIRDKLENRDANE